MKSFITRSGGISASITNGNRIATFSIATSENWKDKDTGERKEKTEWRRVQIYNENLVNVAEKYLKKGSKIYLEGQLENRKYQDKEGNDRYSTEVVVRPYKGELKMLDGSPNRPLAVQNPAPENRPAA